MKLSMMLLKMEAKMANQKLMKLVKQVKARIQLVILSLMSWTWKQKKEKNRQKKVTLKKRKLQVTPLLNLLTEMLSMKIVQKTQLIKVQQILTERLNKTRQTNQKIKQIKIDKTKQVMLRIIKTLIRQATLQLMTQNQMTKRTA
jgi:hypothetical protein